MASKQSDKMPNAKAGAMMVMSAVDYGVVVDYMKLI